METSRAADKAIRLLVGTAAHLYYRGLDADAQAAIRKEFDRMDRSHDGRISLREFMGVLSNKRSECLIPKLFAFVDVDSSGFLDFGEYIIANYLLRPGGPGARMCDSCEAPILLTGYTCMTCWKERGVNGGETFNICFKCYGSRSFSHHHSTLVDTQTMYNMLFSKPIIDQSKRDQTSTDHYESQSQQAQCCVCGDFHRKDIEAMLASGANHMMESKDSIGEFVCEWCFTFGCNKCGKFFKGASSKSTCGKWLRVDLCCTSCGAFGNITNREGLFKGLAESELRHDCKTCAIKMKNGLLWGNYQALESARRIGQIATQSASLTEEEERRNRLGGYR